MSGGPQSDVLMFLVPADSAQPIAAESTSQLAGNDARQMNGFVQGRFFELDTFTFAIDLDDDEGSAAMGSGDTDPRSYGRWRAMKSTNKPNPPFKPEPQDVSVTRRIDAASPVLLKNCLDTKQFSQAVIVKRSRIGRTGMMSAILRLEFSKVWIKAVEWEDGDTMTETCKFKFMSVNAVYIKRNPDGTVASPWSCSWTSAAAKTSRYDV